MKTERKFGYSEKKRFNLDAFFPFSSGQWRLNPQVWFGFGEKIRESGFVQKVESKSRVWFGFAWKIDGKSKSLDLFGKWRVTP